MRDRDFLHKLYKDYYVDRKPKEHYEVCIRCGGKGKLGKRKPYTGLCKKCRKGEYKRGDTG
jgi:hypothetical protein